MSKSAPPDDGERNKRIIMEMLKRTENQHCADCGAKGPRWASATLGTFVCIRCSGIHRSMGTHISFVRSVSLDEWQAKHVKSMVRWGNKRANEYWEARVPDDYYIPDENDAVSAVERWIREKYEKKRFVAKSVPACADADVDLTLPMAQLFASIDGGEPAKKSSSSKSSKSDKDKEKEKASAPAKAAAAPAPAPAAKPAPAPAPAPAPVVKAKPADDDLLGWDFSAPSPAPAAAKPAATAASATFADFGAPAPVPAPTPATSGDAAFAAAFSTGVSLGGAAAAPAHKAGAADIMSLYGSGAPGGVQQGHMQQQQQQQHGMYGGQPQPGYGAQPGYGMPLQQQQQQGGMYPGQQQQPQQGGMGMGLGMMQQQQPQHYPQQGGMPQQAAYGAPGGYAMPVAQAPVYASAPAPAPAAGGFGGLGDPFASFK